MRLVDPTSDMRKKLIRVLARNPLFGEMNPDQLSELSQQAEFCIHPAGELLVRQGEPSDNFFVLVRGHARVFLQSSTGDGENHLARLEAGAALGEMGLLLDEPRSASVRAEDQLLVARLTREIFERMIGELPAFGEAISRALARRLSTTLRKMPLPEAHQEQLPEIEVIRLLPVPLLQRHRIMPLRTEGSVLVLGCVEDIDTSLEVSSAALVPNFAPRGTLRRTCLVKI